MSLASKRIPVTLCCAQEDASHLRPLVIHLEQEGYQVRLIEGVEEDPYLLGSTLDRQRGACVIVACLSDALGPGQFRRIEGVYSARKGPDHFLETIFVEPDETLAMAEGVRAAVAKAKDRRPEAKLRAQRANRRDVVGVTNLSAVGTDAIPSANVTNKASEQPGWNSGSRYASALGSSAPVTADEDASAASTAKGPVPEASASESVAAGSTAGASASATTAQGRQTASWVAPVLFLIFLAVAGTVVLLMLQDKDGDGRVAGRGAPSLSPAPALAQPPPDPGQAAQPVLAAAQPAPDSGQAPSAEAPTSGGEAGPAPDEPAPGSAEEAARIVEAIEAGEMRAIDLILIAKTSELSAWHDASNRCRSKSVNGVRGWRLPTLDELETIREARMVEHRDRYWSSSLAVKVGTGKDHVFVLDLDRQSIEPVSKQAAQVRVLCVRPALQVSEG